MTQPTLTTNRLILRPITAADIPHEQAFHQTDRAEFVGGPMHPADVWRYIATQIGHWTLRGYGTFAVEEKDTGIFCGHVGPWYPADWPAPELSWTIMEAAEGRGLAHEAALATRNWAYDTLGWTTAISMIDPANTRSIALAERLGARHDGTFDHHRYGTMHIWRHPSPAEVRDAP